MELFNIALLARQSCTILVNPDSLCSKMLSAIYFPSRNFLYSGLGTHPSQIWRAVHEGKEALKIGFIQRIGDGRSTRVRDHNWLPRDTNMCSIVCHTETPIFFGDLIKPHSSKKDKKCVLLRGMIVHLVKVYSCFRKRHRCAIKKVKM